MEKEMLYAKLEKLVEKKLLQGQDKKMVDQVKKIFKQLKAG